MVALVPTFTSDYSEASRAIVTTRRAEPGDGPSLRARGRGARHAHRGSDRDDRRDPGGRRGYGSPSQAGVVCDNPARFSSAGQRLMAVILTATAHRGNQPMPETSL